MAFTEDQESALAGKLSAKHVKTRETNGNSLHYVEGWHAISEANRIFGYDAWDRSTFSAKCVWSGMNGRHHSCAYTVKVRIRVRAGDITIVREGSGTGEGNGLTPGEAHDIALKSAETDATKRALATFGNPFGLALYDKEHKGVRNAAKLNQTSSKKSHGDGWPLRTKSGDESQRFNTTEAFAEALTHALNTTSKIEELFDIWEQNIDTIRAVNRQSNNGSSTQLSIGKSLVGHFKSCAIELAKQTNSRPRKEKPNKSGVLNLNLDGAEGKKQIDKSALQISEPKRIRSKAHLRYVARQSCLVCGRKPVHAHHLRFAQPRAMAKKVSDEFTVPLCSIHHTELHYVGDEKAWWKERMIEPLAEAERLWNCKEER